MGVHFEAQTKKEVEHIRSRELQLESVEKLNNIIPTVNALDDVNLQQIEAHVAETKDIVNNNLEQQPDLQDIFKKMNTVCEQLNTISTTLDSMKKSQTQLKKTITEIKNNIKKQNQK